MEKDTEKLTQREFKSMFHFKWANTCETCMHSCESYLSDNLRCYNPSLRCEMIVKPDSTCDAWIRQKNVK